MALTEAEIAGVKAGISNFLENPSSLAGAAAETGGGILSGLNPATFLLGTFLNPEGSIFGSLSNFLSGIFGSDVSLLNQNIARLSANIDNFAQSRGFNYQRSGRVVGDGLLNTTSQILQNAFGNVDTGFNAIGGFVEDRIAEEVKAAKDDLFSQLRSENTIVIAPGGRRGTRGMTDDELMQIDVVQRKLGEVRDRVGREATIFGLQEYASSRKPPRSFSELQRVADKLNIGVDDLKKLGAVQAGDPGRGIYTFSDDLNNFVKLTEVFEPPFGGTQFSQPLPGANVPGHENFVGAPEPSPPSPVDPGTQQRLPNIPVKSLLDLIKPKPITDDQFDMPFASFPSFNYQPFERLAFENTLSGGNLLSDFFGQQQQQQKLPGRLQESGLGFRPTGGNLFSSKQKAPRGLAFLS